MIKTLVLIISKETKLIVVDSLNFVSIENVIDENVSYEIISKEIKLIVVDSLISFLSKRNR